MEDKMHKLKYIFRNINLLNITLITAIIILSNYTVLPMFNMNIRYTLPAGKKTMGDTDEKPADSLIPSLTDYTMIAEENLFHPGRKIPAEKKDEQPLPKPEFVLYGTLITDNINLAYLEDLKAPYSTTGRGKRQRALRLGNTLSDYTLNEIHHDQVVMVRGDDRIILKVDDPSKSRNKDTVKVAGIKPEKTVSTPMKRPAVTFSTVKEDEKKVKKDSRENKKQLREERKKTLGITTNSGQKITPPPSPFPTRSDTSF